VRVLNLGVRLLQNTTLTIKLPGCDASAVLRIGHDGNFAVARFSGPTMGFPLTAGDYVITLDSELRPAPDAPVTVSTGAEVLFMSAGAPQDGVRALVVGRGVQVTESDPKDPWPPLVASASTAAEVSFATSSPILPAMRTLLDAFGGKGAAWAATPSPTIHALLIGIDDYGDGIGRDGALYRPLHGCVRDILDVERFLLDAGVTAERITRLIAPLPGGPGNDLPRSAKPTYENIVCAWQHVISTAKPGDVVYIHYSGHGGRSATLFPAFKSNGLDESIAPCDINQPLTGRYLRDVEIAVLLKQMAQRELLTTLVLDSCYAGSATRGSEVAARRGDRDDLHRRAGDTADSSAVASRAELEDMAKQLATTPRRPDESWRIAPGRETAALITIVAACRPHESSYEYAIDGATRCGVLTHFWLEALRQRGANTTYRTAYRQTFARVQAVFREQAPVLLGAADRLVLGTATLVQPSSIAIVDVDGEHVTIAAGAAGQLCVGTRLAVLPPEVLPELADLSTMRQIEVTSVASTISRARTIRGAGDAQPPITLASHAVVVTYAPTMRRSVRWLASAHPSAAELAARAELEHAIVADTTNAIGLAAAESAHYQVAVESSRFVILDPAGCPLPHLRPEIRVADSGAVRAVKNRLVHLTRFHNVRALTNSDANSPLAGKLALSLHALDGDRPAETPLPLDPILPCDSEFYLRIKNLSCRALSLGIFNLAADWSIEHLNRACPLTVDAGTSIDIKLTASLPRLAGFEVAADVLKVIATTEHTDLEWLTLRALDQPYVCKRAARIPTSAFEELMATMHEPSRATRHVAMAAPTSGWTEAQISLEVRQPKRALSELRLPHAVLGTI
jgi:hypothetical protein